MTYPILEVESERKAIDAFIADLPVKIRKARSRFDDIMRAIGRPTAMIVPGARNWFLPFHRESVTLDSLEEHHYRKVLLVALRMRVRPEEILALWQNEGLPASRRHEGNTSGRLLPLGTWFGRDPVDEEQARAWTVSAVLWERWGLDKLIASSGPDNQPRAASADEHAKAFDAGFKAECVPYVKESPYPYLVDPAGAFEVKRDTGKWQFRSRPEYQATVLLLQVARFRNQLKRIPPFIAELEVPVFTRSVFPALLYMHYNSSKAESHLKRLAKAMVQANRRQPKEEYDGGDLYRAFSSTKLPADVEGAARRIVGGTEMFNGHSWVNALRYEFIRRVYSEVFADFDSSELVSVFIADQ